MTLRSSQTITMNGMFFPHPRNHYGTLFGSHAQELMDQAALVAASLYSRCTFVIACSERLDFKDVVQDGNLIELNASNFATARSSMTVSLTQGNADCASKLDLCSLHWMKREKPVTLRSSTTEGSKEN
jgi:acyl-CoA hydrolase